MSSPIRVMLVDDSAIVRGLVSRALAQDAKFEVVATASNGKQAVETVKAANPDIMVLDIEMPEMDGLTALPLLLKQVPKLKIIMVSTLTLRNASISMQALSLGAADTIPKPSLRGQEGIEDFYRELKTKIIALAGGHTSHAAKAQENTSTPRAADASAQVAATNRKIHALAIASSTGGPQALLEVFKSLVGQLLSVPIFITQHMPPSFTTILAQHIATASARPCMEAQNGMVAKAGHIYLAPGDYHMVAARKGVDTILSLNQNAPENFCRPAADPMLRALSDIYGAQLMVCVLTGMGSDGMLGAQYAKKNGARIIAQNEATCVVYGMPKAVADAGLCESILPLPEIAPYLITNVR